MVELYPLIAAAQDAIGETRRGVGAESGWLANSPSLSRDLVMPAGGAVNPRGLR
jgi:hypothetical protein